MKFGLALLFLNLCLINTYHSSRGQMENGKQDIIIILIIRISRKWPVKQHTTPALSIADLRASSSVRFILASR